MNTTVLSAGVFHKYDTDDEFYKYFESEFSKITQHITYSSTSKKCVQIPYHAVGCVNGHEIIGNNITILPYHMRIIPCANVWLLKHTSSLIIENSFLLYRIPYIVSYSIYYSQFVLFTTPKFLKKNPPVFFGTPRMDEINNTTVNFDNDPPKLQCSVCGTIRILISNNTCAQCIQISKNTVVISHRRRYDIFKYDCGFLYMPPCWGSYGHLFCQIGVDCSKIIIQIKNSYRHKITLIPYLVL